MDDEFVIVDIVECVGNRAGMAGNVLLRSKDDNNKTFGAGIKGTWEFAKDLLINKE